MPQKSKKEDGFRLISGALKSGQIGNFYIFHGEERYLLEHALIKLREKLCPDGHSSFNYKRFEGKDVSFELLEDSINTLPAFAEKTLLEIHDFNIFKGDERQRFLEIFSDLPDYICVVFVYNTIEYKPDGRQKINKDILKHAEVVEFITADQDRLTKWIIRRFEDAGKKISKTDAEYIALITGGLMTVLTGEIEKAAAFAAGETVTRGDIDAVVTPGLDAVAYKLTDALARREYKNASHILSDLLEMREAPHKLIYSISQKMRQLLAARVCFENNLGAADLMEMSGMKFEFQAKTLMTSAKETTLDECKKFVLICSETAFALNSSGRPAESLAELIARLAFAAGDSNFGQSGTTIGGGPYARDR